jgi:hypothetical protein
MGELVGVVGIGGESALTRIYLNCRRTPDEIPAGLVRIAVIYEKENGITEPGNLSHFLSTLQLNEQGRSNEDIMKQIKEERDSWGES